uniref:Uncharacterized protein n=1 Tax=Steinernema glaseri TaxID=37863 RepID=A0A1I7ZJM8_9BILA
MVILDRIQSSGTPLSPTFSRRDNDKRPVLKEDRLPGKRGGKKLLPGVNLRASGFRVLGTLSLDAGVKKTNSGAVILEFPSIFEGGKKTDSTKAMIGNISHSRQIARNVPQPSGADCFLSVCVYAGLRLSGQDSRKGQIAHVSTINSCLPVVLLVIVLVGSATEHQESRCYAIELRAMFTRSSLSARGPTRKALSQVAVKTGHFLFILAPHLRKVDLCSPEAQLRRSSASWFLIATASENRLIIALAESAPSSLIPHAGSCNTLGTANLRWPECAESRSSFPDEVWLPRGKDQARHHIVRRLLRCVLFKQHSLILITSDSSDLVIVIFWLLLSLWIHRGEHLSYSFSGSGTSLILWERESRTQKTRFLTMRMARRPRWVLVGTSPRPLFLFWSLSVDRIHRDRTPFCDKTLRPLATSAGLLCLLPDGDVSARLEGALERLGPKRSPKVVPMALIDRVKST